MALLKKKVQETQGSKSDFVGGIWIKESASGVQYLSISINGVNYVALKIKAELLINLQITLLKNQHHIIKNKIIQLYKIMDILRKIQMNKIYKRHKTMI